MSTMEIRETASGTDRRESASRNCLESKEYQTRPHSISAKRRVRNLQISNEVRPDSKSTDLLAFRCSKLCGFSNPALFDQFSQGRRTPIGVFRKKSKNYSGKYYFCYSLGGKQYFESTGTNNKKLAEKAFALRQAEIFAAKWDLPVPASAAPRLREWADKLLKSVQTTSTRIRYQSSIQHLCRHWGDDTRISNITSRSIAEFVERRREKVGPACINRDLGTLRRLLSVAVQQRLIAKSPFQQGQVSFLNERSTRRQPTIVDFETERKILAHCVPHTKALAVVLLETGLRVAKEGLALRWADIDLSERILTVRASKTTSGIRSVPLSNFCTTELLRWRELVGENFSEFVFPNLSDPTKPIKSVKGSWLTATEKAGVKPFPIYDLRATFASRLSSTGVSDNFVSQMLGHATGSLLRTYSKATGQYQREAIQKLEELRFRSQVDA
jgi:integrase